MQRPIISTAIVSLIVISLAFFLVLPKYDELNAKNFQVEEKRFRFETLEDYFKDISFKNEELKKYESEMAKINSALPDDSNMPSVFYFIQNTAEENGISLISVDLSSTRRKAQERKTGEIEESELKENAFSINVAGSYTSFKDFLSVLEKSARLIEVEEISFSSAGGKRTIPGMAYYPSKDIFFFDLQMKVYSY